MEPTASRAPRREWGYRDKAGRWVHPCRSKREAQAMASYHGGVLLRREWTGPDRGWSDWEQVRP